MEQTEMTNFNEADEYLAMLARNINAELTQMVQGMRTSLIRAKRAGDFLIDAKQRLKRGEWTLWLLANVSLSVRSAQNYMLLARKWNELPHPLPVAGLRDALALLAYEGPDEDEDAADDTNERAAEGANQASEQEREEQTASDTADADQADGGQEGTGSSERKTDVDPETELERWPIQLPHTRMAQLKQQLGKLMPVYSVDVLDEALAQSVAADFALKVSQERVDDVCA